MESERRLMKIQLRKIAGIGILSCALCLGWGQAAQAQDVKVTLPSFKVTLNGLNIEQSTNQYPFILYKDITYVPMTYYDARLLGLSTAWDNTNGLKVEPLSFIPDAETAQSQYKPYTSSTTNQGSYTASIAQFKINVSGETIDNSKEEYPLLVFRDVTYFPLTWRFAVDTFGWQYNFNLTDGLTITPVPTKVFDSYVGVVDGSVVNVRSDATTESTAITQVLDGTRVTVTGEKKAANGDLWYNVTLSNGTKGYIASWLIVDEATYNANHSSQNNNQTTPSNPTGEISQISLLNMITNDDETILIFDVGSSAISSSQSSASTVNITMANAKCDTPLDLNLDQGPLASTKLSQSNNQISLTLQMKDGAYCTVNKNNDTLTLRIRHRDLENSGLAGKTIVIDPGHGSLNNGVVDPGAIGRVLGFTDREVGTTIGFKLKDILEAQGATVIMTRGEEPVNMTLYDRTDLANENNADLFISIHGNALDNNYEKNGIEVYYYCDGATLTSSAQSYIRKEFATDVSNALGQATGRSSTTKTSNFVVIRETDCPSILVEAGYLSNAEDEALLASDSYQSIMANGIYQGIAAYFAAY